MEVANIATNKIDNKPLPANKQKGEKVCSCCGEKKSLVNGFYASANPLYSSDKRVPICKTCIRDLCINSDTGEIEEVKLNNVLKSVQKPYFKDDLASAYSQFAREHSYIDESDVKRYGEKILGLYFKNTMLRQNRDLSYDDSESQGFMHQTSNISISEKQKIINKYSDIQMEKLNDTKAESRSVDVSWSEQDSKNKNYVLQSVGYDCFNDENYTDQNKKFLFNTMADYLTDDVLEDPHKMQRVISLVKTTLQLDSVDKLITSELKKQNPDNSLIKSFTGIKDKLERTINSSANENGISAKSSGKGSKGSNALTNIMKEMGENGFEEIKVNLVNIKLSESYKEISADNAKSLFNELNFTTDEFAKMVATQSEEIIAYQDKIMKLEEDIRLLKVENKRLKCKITELGGDE